MTAPFFFNKPFPNAEMARRYRKEWGHPRRRPENSRLHKLAAMPAHKLRSVLDNPALDPNVEITPNWPFALEVALHATPRVFDAWVLRGMNPYARNCEGITAMEIGNVKLLRHLIHAFGMSPDLGVPELREAAIGLNGCVQHENVGVRALRADARDGRAVADVAVCAVY